MSIAQSSYISVKSKVYIGFNLTSYISNLLFSGTVTYVCTLFLHCQAAILALCENAKVARINLLVENTLGDLVTCSSTIDCFSI